MLSESIHLPKSIKDAENRFLVVLKEQLLKIVKEVNGKLSLSGGVMNGTIVLPKTETPPSIEATFVRAQTDDEVLMIYGGSQKTTGARIGLNGKDKANDGGAFSMTAANGVNESKLQGLPNGILFWNGKRVTAYGNVETITPTVNTTNVASVGSYQYCCRCGVVVSLGINIQVKANTAIGQQLLTGLPAPPAKIACSLAGAAVPLRCYIDTDGSLKLDGASPNSLQWFDGSVTYITNS